MTRKGQDAELAAYSPRPSASREPPPDVAELVRAEVDRTLALDRQAAEAAEIARRAHPTGGGCAWCGIGYSNTDHPDPWTPLDGQLICVGCWNWHCVHDRLADTSADRRVRIAAALLGLDGLPLIAVGNPHAFDAVRLFFDEHDAEPATEPWAHIDLAELRRSWDRVINGPEPPPPPTCRGRKCPTCGGRDYLVLTGQPISHWPIEGAEIGDQAYIDRVERSLCAMCRRNWLAQAGGGVLA